MKTKLIICLLVLPVCIASTSCGTMYGLGQDIKKLGGSVNNKIRTGTWGSAAPAYQTPVAPAYQPPSYQPPAHGVTDFGPADAPPPR